MRIARSGFILLLLSAITFSGIAQDKSASSATEAKSTVDQQDPLKRPFSEKERKKRAKLSMTEDFKRGQKWVEQDVKWIITDAEREAFAKLSNDDERDAFIEHFWEVRDPTPDTAENEYKDEYYRRIT